MQLLVYVIESHVLYPLALLYLGVMSFGMGLLIGFLILL